MNNSTTTGPMGKERFLKPFVALTVAVGALIIAFSAYTLHPLQLDLRFLFLLCFSVLLGSRLVVQIPRVKAEITVSDTFVFLTMLLCGGPAATLVSAAAAVSSSLKVTKKVSVVLFNAAVMACSTFLTVWMLQLCFGSLQLLSHGRYSAAYISAICLMGLVQYITNTAIVTVYTACKHNQPFWRIWRKDYLWTSVTYFAGASGAFLIARFISAVGFFAVIATMPIIAIVYFTYRIYLKNIDVSLAQAEQAKHHAEVLRESEERFRSAFDYATIGMALVATEGHWLQVNHSLCEILGYSETELLALDFQALTHPQDLNTVLRQLGRVREGESPTCQMEQRYLHKQGHEVWALLSVSQLRDVQSHSLHFIFQIQDITHSKLAEARLVHNAFHDALTGLPNRALFIDHLNLALERSKRHPDYSFAVLFLDLDRFKVVNDSLGHDKGDQLLVEIARRLESCLRPGDTAARLGGDEFTILLEDLTSDQAIEVAERIQQILNQPFDLKGHTVFSTASIGIVTGSGYEQAQSILRDADTAMYQAKSRGSMRPEVFDKSMHANVLNLLQLETDLRRAVERQEFVVYYQPIVSLDNFKVRNFEALVRWKHPQYGLIEPTDFIPLAEDTGLIIPIGHWVLRQACAQMRQWQECFPGEVPLSVSVNLSGKQFLQPDLIAQVQQVLEETGLHASSLKLEITESVVMENIEATTEMLNQLRALGVGLSMDDFGTGYSSLSHLHRFPISTLKIDRSFVSRMNGNNENAEIVRTIMLLAQSLGMDVVAEGVETIEQVTQLRALGCESGQGFYFSRPTAVAAAELLLADISGNRTVSLPRYGFDSFEELLIEKTFSQFFNPLPPPVSQRVQASPILIELPVSPYPGN